MKEITINGKTLQYQTFWDGNEAGEWCWTEFYDGFKTVEKRKRWWSKEKVTLEILNEVFTINEDSQNPRITKDWWKKQIEKELELLNRSEQLKNGELI